jgi:hypothetical protein
MYAGKKKTHTLRVLTTGWKVENITVEKIFKQGPECEPGQKQRGKGNGGNTNTKTFPNIKNDHGQIDGQYGHRRDFAQTLQQSALEQPDLTFLGCHMLWYAFGLR